MPTLDKRYRLEEMFECSTLPTTMDKARNMAAHTEHPRMKGKVQYSVITNVALP